MRFYHEHLFIRIFIFRVLLIYNYNSDMVRKHNQMHYSSKKKIFFVIFTKTFLRIFYFIFFFYSNATIYSKIKI